jgi:Mn-containing catalase
MILRVDRLAIDLPSQRIHLPIPPRFKSCLVWGGVHIVAYAKALEKLTGVDVGKLLPIPDISNKQFPEARKLEEQGRHRILFRWSPEDFKEIGQIWNGKHPEDGSVLRVEEGMPTGAPAPDLPEEPQLTAPGLDSAMIEDVAKRLFR